MLAGSKTDRTFLFRKPACEKHAGFCPAGGPEKKEPEKKNSEEKIGKRKARKIETHRTAQKRILNSSWACFLKQAHELHIL